ncbi:MAG: DUF4044 domain-containing protein [Clostridiales bacterium]|nr:DUF4044 domain-containing protein [Clostridiales bacterium]
MLYSLYILKVGFFMNKKTRKILVWVMLFLMIASFIAGIAVYAIS